MHHRLGGGRRRARAVVHVRIIFVEAGAPHLPGREPLHAEQPRAAFAFRAVLEQERRLHVLLAALPSSSAVLAQALVEVLAVPVRFGVGPGSATLSQEQPLLSGFSRTNRTGQLRGY